MPEPTQYQLTMQEIATLIIREQRITSGHWEAGLVLSNTACAIGLQKVIVPTPLSVDAAMVGAADFPVEM